MAETRPSPLNGAYYGPSIPPHPQYHRPRRASPLGCLLCTLLKIFVPIVIIIGVAAFVLWLVFRPNELKVHVEDARLSQFNLTNGNKLQYRLDLNVSVRNPNKKLGFYYDLIEAVAIYDDNRFAFTPLPTFYQGHKNTTILRPTFSSQAVVLVGSATETYAREKADGFYNIEVKFYTRVRVKAGRFKSRHLKPKFDCDLRLPAPPSAGNSGPTPAFQRTKCDVDF
ncbi:hypothetical protein HPP92_006555 [Vanilla planifolia]|uniref:Late embryogenesis abundant protein LEA-2 subgroup domain-containing protein n=1 Tax=Vanilla planifolia TaxID=51239 RepID=A0A835V830_VANPL|nr:hypothetical protein HPP92_006814 [Vanilla planifolia]KAG0489692.1 hypothetical protein HPP92_006555 [Vanilla planifolia]